MILQIFLAAASMLYALQYAFLFRGIRRSHRVPRGAPVVWPRISILVAARNEEATIGNCLNLLLAQNYPHDRMEIIAINDESEDATLEVMKKIGSVSGGRIRIISTVAEASDVRGKARAIAQGMDYAEGEIALFTDADCSPPPLWARSVVEHFSNDVDAYCGFTLIQANSLFSATQQLDWLHLQTIGAAAMSLGHPIGVIGNNMAFRRSAYDAVGGYRAVKFSVTEDFALFRYMVTHGIRFVYPCSADTRMFTLPCPTIRDVLRQKQRWGRGATAHVFPGGLVLIFALVMLAAFCAAPFVSLTSWFVVWTVKFALDLGLMVPNMKRLGIISSLKYFLLFEFYFIAQALVVPFLIMNRTVVWKGRSYQS